MEDLIEIEDSLGGASRQMQDSKEVGNSSPVWQAMQSSADAGFRLRLSSKRNPSRQT